MYKVITTFFSFFIVFNSQSQVIEIKKTISDSKTKITIAYATIQILNSQKYLDADFNGKFNLLVDNNDSIEISCIGFEKTKFKVSDILKRDTLYIKNISKTMETVYIGKFEKKIIGTVNEKSNTSSTGGNIAARTEFAMLIDVPTDIKAYRISKIYIKGKKFKEENPVRLHIYDTDINGLPGKELLNKERIITNNDADGKTVTIDLLDQEIILKKSTFFVSIQWITSDKVKIFTGPEIYETYKNSKQLTFRRQQNIKNNTWCGNFKKNMMIFYPSVNPENDTPVNIMTSAEIEILEK